MSDEHYQRSLRLLDAALIVVGGIVGGGIFLNPGIAAQRTASSAALLLTWVGAGLITLIGALCYAELGARRPQAGGSYVYLREAFGPLTGFLFGWTMLLVIYSGSSAAVATIFASYTADLLGLGPSAVIPLACALLVGVIAINRFGLRSGVRLLNLFTLLKLLAIAALVGCGLYLSGLHGGRIFAADPARTSVGWLGAALPVLFAYSGFTYLNNLAGEIDQPQRTLPRALLLGMLLVIVIYLLVNLAYLGALGHDGLAASHAPAAEVMARLGGPLGSRLIAVGIAISTLGFCNLTLISGARVLQAMGEDGLIFRAFGRIHPRRHTPDHALLLLTGWSIVLILTGSYGELLDYAAFGDWLACALGIATLFWYRRHETSRPRFQVPLYPWLPAIFILSVALVVIATLYSQPRNTCIGLAIIVAGVPVYHGWQWFKCRTS